MNPQNQKLYVGNLNYDATEEQVRELFAAYGIVVEVKIIKDRDTKASRGFAFVTMGSDKEAAEARDALNGKQEFQGKVLLIDWARTEQRDRPMGERRGSGGEFRGAGRRGGDWNSSSPGGRERRDSHGSDRYRY